ncbi:MAG: TIM barrel protein [Lentisphaerae bacterium]|jgi:sugar phosphate isomerase/epimerase|nr:TIM barrel protein [Lentisphaerota bacterium]MBT5608248.1 TIM barrel protein [Lentisphaerota bacterium]MBT7061184.1 TIM barrel protein [Lentisphaerota bacterium]MBT7846742.1 TIM barrel protein [Lentisphaerota bacterium]
MSDINVGIQLYTVREHTDDDSFRATLAQLAEMGFQGVEFAWKYGGMEPEELAGFLDELGLACCGMHVQLDELLDPGHRVYDIALACGSPYVTTSLANRVDAFESLVPELENAGRIAADKGLRFTYHNHYQEFAATVDGQTAQDYLTAHAPAEWVGLEIDLGWIHKAGLDAMAYWRRHGARTPQVHLRDYDREHDRVTDVGAGFLDMRAVAAQGEELGLDWLIFEQDRFPVSPFASCRVCLDRAREAGMLTS